MKLIEYFFKDLKKLLNQTKTELKQVEQYYEKYPTEDKCKGDHQCLSSLFERIRSIPNILNQKTIDDLIKLYKLDENKVTGEILDTLKEGFNQIQE